MTMALVWAAVIQINAQDLIDVVYLRNGDVVKGSIIKPLDEDGVQIMNSSSDVFTFSAKEVKRVAREKMVHENLKNEVYAYQPKGFTNMTRLEFGFGIGALDVGGMTTDNDLGYVGIHNISGWHINDMLSLGLGIGVDFHGDAEGYNQSFALIPIFANVRFTPVKRTLAPYFYADLGYGAGIIEPDVSGGLMAGFGGGVQWSTSRNTAVFAGLAYRFQAHDFEDFEAYNANYLNLNVGFKF